MTFILWVNGVSRSEWWFKHHFSWNFHGVKTRHILELGSWFLLQCFQLFHNFFFLDFIIWVLWFQFFEIQVSICILKEWAVGQRTFCIFLILGTLSLTTLSWTRFPRWHGQLLEVMKVGTDWLITGHLLNSFQHLQDLGCTPWTEVGWLTPTQKLR